MNDPNIIPIRAPKASDIVPPTNGKPPSPKPGETTVNIARVSPRITQLEVFCGPTQIIVQIPHDVFKEAAKLPWPPKKKENE